MPTHASERGVQTVDTLLLDWSRDGFTRVRREEPHGRYAAAADAFAAFAPHITGERKENIRRRIESGRPSQPGFIGYSDFFPKTPEEGVDRVFFHYHPAVRETFGTELTGIPGAEKFLDSAEPLWRSALSSAEDVVRSLETRYPGLYGRFFPKGIPPAFVIRFVVYAPGGDTGCLQKPHYDRCPITLALAESAPGLRVKNSDGQMTSVSRKHDEAVVMTGPWMRNLDPDFPLSWHDAAAVSGRGTNEARWVAVGQLFPGGLNFLEEEADD